MKGGVGSLLLVIYVEKFVIRIPVLVMEYDIGIRKINGATG